MTGGKGQEWRILQAILEEMKQNMWKDNSNDG